MFFRGTGAQFSPDVPLVDKALGKGLSRLGFKGGRARGTCVFAAVSEEQALGYAGDGRTLLSVVALPGSTVTWAEGSGDLVLRFEAWLSSVRFDHANGLGRGATSLLRDLAGDSQTLETYLSLGRQRRNIEAIVDAFLATAEIREAEIREGDDVASVLGAHRGEVWITGPCRMEERPVPEAAFRP